MQRKNGKLITPAEYARLRGLNRSTISRQVAEGKIPTVDGLIDPAAADQGRERNLHQGRRAQQAERKQNGRPVQRHVDRTAPQGRGTARDLFEALIAGSARLPEILAELDRYPADQVIWRWARMSKSRNNVITPDDLYSAG